MKMILSILSIKDDISDDDNDENAGEVELLSSSEMNRSVQQLKFHNCIEFEMGKEFGNYTRLH